MSGPKLFALAVGPDFVYRFSFEFFPPRSPKSADALRHAARRLCRFAPQFLSVTYGAGGTSRDATFATLVELGKMTGRPMAGHLTCIGAARQEVDAVAEDYWGAGVRHIVAIRGDPPEGTGTYQPHPGGYRDAADLVDGLRRIADFEISVAGYPEVHPDSSGPESDLDNLKRKIEAGASRIITQFCFDPNRILRFVERVRTSGVHVPISIGVLPIASFETAAQFSDRCGASIPEWMNRVFSTLSVESARLPHVAESIAANQCSYLQARGIRDFHFYTLNRSDLTGTICRYLRWQARR